MKLINNPDWFFQVKTNLEMRWANMYNRGYLVPNELFFVRNNNPTPRIGALFCVMFLLAVILSACNPSERFLTPTANTNTMTEGKIVIPASVEVELDIFSGNPNPTWTLSDKDVVIFLERLATLPKTTAKEMSTNLGYRGFIVQVTSQTEQSLVRIQNGTVQLSQGGTNVYYSDQNRDLEGWLLNSGKPSLKRDLFKIVENEFP